MEKLLNITQKNRPFWRKKGRFIMMYKCPNCGKISTTMYCDTCEKAIPRNCAVESYQLSGEELGKATSQSTDEIKSMMKTLTSTMESIEHDTHVIYIIVIIFAIISAINAAFGIIGTLNLLNLLH